MYCCKSVSDGSLVTLYILFKNILRKKFLHFSKIVELMSVGQPLEKNGVNLNHTTTLTPVMYSDLPSTCLSPMGLPATWI